MTRRRVWKPQQVVLTWVDACEHGSMSGPRGAVIEKAKLVTRETLGYLVYQDEHRTLLARNYDPPLQKDDEPEVDSIIVIPTGWVTGIRHINRSRKRGEHRAQESGRHENLQEHGEDLHAQTRRPEGGSREGGAGLSRDGTGGLPDPQSVPQEA